MLVEVLQRNIHPPLLEPVDARDRAQWVVSQYLTYLFGPNDSRTVLHAEGVAVGVEKSLLGWCPGGGAGEGRWL